MAHHERRQRQYQAASMTSAAKASKIISGICRHRRQYQAAMAQAAKSVMTRVK